MQMNKLANMSFTQEILLEKDLESEMTEKITPVPTEQTSEELYHIEQFAKEVMALLKHTRTCCIDLSQFESSYYNHFQKKCDAHNYGFTELRELLEAIPSVAEIKGKRSQTFLLLAKDKYYKVIAERIIAVIKDQPFQMLEMSKLHSEFVRHHGYKLKRQRFRWRNLSSLFNKLKGYIKVTMQNGVYYICRASGFFEDETLHQVSLNIRSILMEQTDGAMQLSAACCLYEKRFGPDENLISYLKQMGNIVQIDNGYLKLTPMQLFAKNMIILLKENSGQMKTNEVKLAYQNRFGVYLSASDYECKTTSNLLRHFPDYFTVAGTKKTTGGHFVYLKSDRYVYSSDVKHGLLPKSVSPLASLNEKQNFTAVCSDIKCNLPSSSVSSLASLNSKGNDMVYSSNARRGLPTNSVSSIASLKGKPNIGGNIDMIHTQVPSHIAPPVMYLQAQNYLLPPALNAQASSHLLPAIFNVQTPCHQPMPTMNALDPNHRLTSNLNAQFPSHWSTQVWNAQVPSYLQAPVLNSHVSNYLATKFLNAPVPVVSVQAPRTGSIPVFNTHVSNCLPMETWMMQGFGDLLGFERSQNKDDPWVGQPYFQSIPSLRRNAAAGGNSVRTSTTRHEVSTTESSSQTCSSPATNTHSVSCPEICANLSTDCVQNSSKKCQRSIADFHKNTQQPDSSIINAPEMRTSGEKQKIKSANQNAANSPVKQEDYQQQGNNVCSLIIGQNSVSSMSKDLTESNKESFDAKKKMPSFSITSTCDSRQQKRRNRIAAKFSIPLIY